MGKLGHEQNTLLIKCLVDPVYRLMKKTPIMFG